MRRRGSVLWLLLLACVCGPAQGSEHNWRIASDIGAYGLIAVALTVPVVRNDRTGAWQALKSIAVAESISFGLKQIVSEERPDERGDDSFPSAHTSRAFSAAATLHRRYGWRAGIPATAVAALVGVARVEADRHHWRDVIAGAAIGELSGMLLTERLDDQVRLWPWLDRGSGGIQVALRF